jgi:hypothetical protein
MTISPTLNINGTSAADLIDPRRAAFDALTNVISILKQVTPNGRDYPGNADRCDADRREHFDRLLTLNSLREQIYAEAVAINRNKGDAA